MSMSSLELAVIKLLHLSESKLNRPNATESRRSIPSVMSILVSSHTADRNSKRNSIIIDAS